MGSLPDKCQHDIASGRLLFQVSRRHRGRREHEGLVGANRQRTAVDQPRQFGQAFSRHLGELPEGFDSEFRHQVLARPFRHLSNDRAQGRVSREAW